RGVGLYAVLAGAVLIGELFPIRVRRGDVVHEITTSTTFAFALMLGWGTAGGIAALFVASGVADIIQRKSLLKVAFNASQYAISLGLAGMVFHGFGGSQLDGGSGMWPGVSELPLLLAAAGTFFVLNEILPSVAISLAGAVPVRQHVLSTLAFDAAVASALLAMAPVVVVLVDHSALLLPVVAFPVVTVYVGARAMLRNIEVFESKNAELEELNRLKDDFVAMVSHELRTPLTSIKGSVKTLVALGQNLPEQDRASLLEAVDRKSDHLHTLIERLLVVSRLEAGRQEDKVSHTRVGLGAVCAEVLLDLKPSIGDRYFNVDFDPPVVEVETDMEKVHQIISNLVENALKYSYPRSDITLRCRVEPGAAVFSVEDHGPGIHPAARERLFDRFYQVDQSRTREVGGIGLGLYISRSLARALGGELWLDENYSAGCRFCLRIPGLVASISADQITAGNSA
ncbi:MAG TPA: HAMP domain-containing sensor histidine kinase, partial [Actinomycetota bacterium]|nr:HAMP domain-containing sensor histidine kinase [Actinomycetota bacterium]